MCGLEDQVCVVVCVCVWNEWNACVRVRVWSECEMRVWVSGCHRVCACAHTWTSSTIHFTTGITREKGTLLAGWLTSCRSTQRVLS